MALDPFDRAARLGINLNKPALTLSEARAALNNNNLSAAEAAAQLGKPVANMQTGKLRQPDGTVIDIPGNKSDKGITVSQARFVAGNDNLSAKDAARVLGIDVVNAQTGSVAKYDAGKAASEQRKATEGLKNLFNDEYDVIKTEGKKQGLSQASINSLLADERQSNAQELRLLRASQGISGVQTLGLLDGSYRSGMNFGEVLPSAANVMNAGYEFLDRYNIPLSHNDGKTIVGFETYAEPGVRGSGVLDAGYATLSQQGGKASINSNLSRGNESPRTVQNFVKYYNSILSESANPTLSKNAKVIDSGTDPQGNKYQVISDTVAEGIKGGVSGTFVKYADGRIQMLSASPQITPTGGSFWDKWGGLILGVASGFALGPLAGFLGGGTATVGSTVLAGGLLGAGSSALTGGDILTGALLGAAGGYASGVIGQAGGLGNYFKNAGVGISDDLARTLNGLVSGTTVASPDDIAAARNAVSASAAAGAIDDAAASTITNSLDDVARASDEIASGGFRLTPSQVEDFIPTPQGAGTILRPNVVPGAGLVSTGTGAGFNPNAPGSGFNVNPEQVIRTPIGGGTMPPPDVTDLGINSYIPPPIGAGTLPVIPNPNPNVAGGGRPGTGGSLVDDAIGLITRNPEIAASVVGAVAGAQQPPSQQQFEMPAWVTDPSQSAVAGRIAMANEAFLRAQQPLPNLFNAQFQRGGLGAGQYLGYDLLNRTGNIPQGTLLGVPTLAMAPLNLLGVTGGQTPTSQTALV